MNIRLIALLIGVSCAADPLFAQDKPMSEMNWPELYSAWETIASKGQFKESLPYARAVLEKARVDSSEQSLAYGNSLDALGFSLHHFGLLNEAEHNFTLGVEHARTHQGEAHEDYITRLSNLAMLHMDMRKLSQAAGELEQAVQLADRYLEPDNPYVPIIINNLGLVLETMGNYDKALENYLRALQLTEKTAGKASFRYAIRLNNIAAIYRNTDKPEIALEYYHQARAIFQQTVGNNHLDYNSAISGEVNALQMLGRQNEACLLADTLLTWLDTRANQESMPIYNMYSNLVSLYLRLGRYEQCIALGTRIQQRFLDIFPAAYNNHIFVSLALMESCENMGQLQKAVENAVLLHQFLLKEMRLQYSKLSEAEQRIFYRSTQVSSEDAFLLFASRHPEIARLNELACDYLLNAKSITLRNRQELFRSLRSAANMGLTAQYEDWQQLQTEISRQYAVPPARRKPELDSMLQRANTLERNLAFYSQPFRLGNSMTNWQEVQLSLSPGEAAIEFARVQRNVQSPVRYFAWIIKPDVPQPQVVFLFEESALGKISATKQLYAPEPTPDRKNLRQLIWEPLKASLQGVKTAFYAPAGKLNLINLGAIPIDETQVLSDRIQLHRMVSTRALVERSMTEIWKKPESAVVFGGIRYEADSTALAPSNQLATADNSAVFRGEGDWNFLNGSLIEAQQVSQRLQAVGARVLFAEGFGASEGLLKKQLNTGASPDVLHLATHGFFVAVRDSNAQTGFATATDPMARAGLVLSGANRVWSGNAPFAGQEDGVLTALEISRCDMSATDLVVLSACGTGQGQLEVDDGVLGLQRAFKMAGAPYIMMTLWNVSDQDAREFMDYFYKNWLEGKQTVPEAFNSAQRQMRSNHNKPFQPQAWAGFILLE